MGKRGAPPKPTALKKLQGTERKDRSPQNEPMPDVRAPEIPRWLHEVPWGVDAVEEWEILAPFLVRLNLLTEIDRINFAALCDAVGRFCYYRRRVRELGDVMIAESGYRAKSPEMSMMKDALADMRKFGAIFGLSPSDRTRISVPEKPADEKRGLLALVK